MRGRRGLLVTIEGVDAVGKKTQSRMLVQWLSEKGLRSELLGFPDYGTRIGREIKGFLRGERDYPMELKHLLFAANRWERLDRLHASISRSTVLVINRYTESNLAYGRANGLSVRWLAGLEEGLPKADLVIVLDAPPASLISRRPSNKDTFEANTLFQSKVRRAYRRLAADFGWTIIDATGSIAEVQKSIRNLVFARLRSTGRRMA